MISTSANSPQMLPLNASQRGIWRHLQVNPGTVGSYHVDSYTELLGDIDPDLFEAALKHTIQVTTALRLRFVVHDSVPKQFIRDAVDIEIPYLDLSTEPDAESRALAWMVERRSFFDPNSDTLYRFALLKVAAGRYFWFYRFHHLLLDGYSLNLIWARVADVYSSLVRGESPRVADDRADFMRFLEDERSYLESDAYRDDHEYWSRTDASRSSTPSVRSGVVVDTTEPLQSQTYRLEASITEQLNRLCKQLNVDLPRLMMTAALIYLQKICGTTHVSVRLPLHGRFDELSRRLIVTCSTALPFGVELAPFGAVHEAVARVTSDLRAILKHKRYRFDDPTRVADAGSVALNVLPIPTANDFGGSPGFARAFTPRHVDDIVLWVFYGSDGGRAALKVDGHPALYEQWEIDALAASFHDVVIRLSALQPSDAIAALRESAPPDPALDRADMPRSVCERIAEYARRNPHGIAIRSEQADVTYRELLDRSQRRAAFLAASGVEHESVVGVLCGPNVDSLVSMLAILQAGAVYLPIDPSDPRERIEYMLADAGATRVLMSADAVELAVPGITIFNCAGEMDAASTLASPLPNDPSQLACCIYVSGSTGRPKGIGLTHAGLTSHARSFARALDLTDQDRVLQLAPLGSGASLEEIIPAWCVGATVVLNADARCEPRALLAQVEREHVSVLSLPVAHWEECIASDAFDQLPRHLRCIVIGGELVSLEGAARWQRLHGDRVKLLNTYGVTEAANSCTVQISPGLDATSLRSIGRPLDHARIFIVNQWLERVPVGAVGELCIAGDALARGYIDLPGMTAERFVPCPFLIGERMYRTGDRARYLPDGSLELLGRLDRQVKLGSRRVELEEIEVSLRERADVSDCVVLVRERGKRRELLTYVTPANRASCSAAELREYLAARVPVYMLPEHLQVIDVMPRTAKGVVDRIALLSKAPATGDELETLLVRLWAETLRLPTVDIHDNFFALGGHSILAFQLVAKARRAGLDFKLRELFEYPHIAELRHVVRRRERRGALPAATPSSERIVPIGSARRIAEHARCIHERFSAQAAHAPDAIAVTYGMTTMTFGALDARSTSLARELRQRGIRQESIVAVCVPRSPELIVTLLGILKAGAAYLPIDSRQPAARMAHMILDSGAQLLVEHSSARCEMPSAVARLAIDGWQPEHGGAATAVVPTEIDAATLAYVIYTSGSTGRPKGVAVPHAAVMNYVDWAADAYDIVSGEGAVISTSIAFDATVTSLLVPLLSGQRVHLLPEDDGELDALVEIIASGRQYSLVKFTPSHLRALQPEIEALLQRTGVRSLVMGGEALRAADVAPWRQQAPRTRLINQYGPTEATVACAMYEIDPTCSDALIPIGRPIANVRLYVLDENLERVPPGTVGELYIAGVGLARGYVRDAKRTAERFLPDPFSDDGARMYRTGDRARCRADGKLEFVGRSDRQVKINGYRVELGEIEAVACEHAQVRSCAVVANESGARERIVAYVSADASHLDAAALREFMALRLPPYMVPQRIVVLKDLPKTTSGKVDVVALRALDLNVQGQGRAAMQINV